MLVGLVAVLVVRGRAPRGVRERGAALVDLEAATEAKKDEDEATNGKNSILNYLSHDTM